MSSPLEEDKNLLLQCFAGEQEAREAFVRRFSKLVYQAVGRTLSSKNVDFNQFDLDDLHNTVFERLLDEDCRKLRQYKGKNQCSLATWVKVVTGRMVLDHLRKKGFDSISAQKRRVPVEEVFEFTSRSADPLKKVEEEEQVKLLEKAIEYLTPQDRLFVQLHFNKELPVQEVCEIMGLSSSNAYTMKNRALKKMRDHVDSFFKNGKKP